MTTEIRVPTLGESVTEATIGQWFRKEGEEIKADEPIVELETDKVTIEVPAPASGVLSSIAVGDGETVEVGAVLGSITEGDVSDTTTSAGPDPVAQKAKSGEEKEDGKAAAKAKDEEKAGEKPAKEKDTGNGEMPPSPAAKKLLEEKGISADDVDGSGKRGQVLKEDVLAALDKTGGKAREDEEAPKQARAPAPADDAGREERVRMTRLRQTIARRLKDAQNTAAMLTTFNEVDMTNVMAMRSEFKETFEKKHGVKLGFMGFFIKAAIQALKDVPDVNAEIDGTDIIYKNYYHIGVAVGTDRGLVVPVVKDADHLSIADIEKQIGDFGKRARDGQLKIEDMQGGTFTLSNGGVYGSLMSTPILNAPQSGILGMHKIQQRPVVVEGEIKARPMMYLALSYDHRIVDGKDAVTFLVRLKEAVEDPQRLILDL